MVLPTTSAEALALIATRLRQLGLRRILYGSDAASGGNLPPREGWAAFRRLPLTDAGSQLLEKNPGLLGAIRDLCRDGGPHMGVREVQLQAAPQPRILRAARELVERVLLERIHAAEADETIGKTCDLPTRPVVFRLDPLVFVHTGCCGIPQQVRDGQDGGTTDSSRVQERDEVVHGDRLHTFRFGNNAAEQVLMMIGDRPAISEPQG